MHDHRQRPVGEGRREQPVDDQEDLPRLPDRRGERAARPSPSSSPAAPTCRRRRRSSSPAASSSATSPAPAPARSRRSRWSSATPPPAAPTCPGMSDYTVMVKERAKVFLGGPPLVKMATGEESDDESLGGAEMHARTSGLADYLAEDERDAIRIGRRIVARLNWRKARADSDVPPYAEPDADPDDLLDLIPSRPQGAVRPARGHRPALRRRERAPTARSSTSSSRSTAPRWSPAGPGCTAARSASSPTPRACSSARRRRRRRSSSSSPTRPTPRCCSCTTRPATWSARTTSRAASSSTAR